MTQAPTSTARDTVLNYHRAWTSGDLDRAMALVDDDIVCHAPGENLTGKEAYRAYLAAFTPNLTGLTDVASFADGDRVALFYYPHTAATSTAAAAEYFTVRGDVIVDSVLVFDRLSFVPPDER